MSSFAIWQQLIENWKNIIPPRPIHSPEPARYPGGPKPEGVKPKPYTNPDSVPRDWYNVRGRPIQKPPRTPYTNPILTIVGAYIVISEAIDWLETSVNQGNIPSTADFERELDQWIKENPLKLVGGTDTLTGAEIDIQEVEGTQDIQLDVLDLQEAEAIDGTPRS